jgi:hypothetical protein
MEAHITYSIINVRNNSLFFTFTGKLPRLRNAEEGFFKSRVVIFRQKDHSAEYGTDGTNSFFRRNSVCVTGKKRRNSIPNHSAEEKNARNSVLRGRENPSEFRSEPLTEEKNAPHFVMNLLTKEENASASKGWGMRKKSKLSHRQGSKLPLLKA